MELLKIENGHIQCQEFSKVKLSTIKKATYERMEGCFAVVLHIKNKASISWVFEKSAEAKEVHQQLQSALETKT